MTFNDVLSYLSKSAMLIVMTVLPFFVLWYLSLLSRCSSGLLQHPTLSCIFEIPSKYVIGSHIRLLRAFLLPDDIKIRFSLTQLNVLPAARKTPTFALLISDHEFSYT